MKKLNVKLENCYGIKTLNHEFDFSGCQTICIYAPNGSMKTSFAKTLIDFSNGDDSKDYMDLELVSLRELKDELNNEPAKESIFVINSYDEEFSSERVSTLVANSTLRKRYEILMLDIKTLKITFMNSIKKEISTKLDIEDELKKVFNIDDFTLILKDINKELLDGIDYDFSEVEYDTLFNLKSINFIQTEDFKTQLKDYINLYDSLLDKSRFLKNGLNHYKANKIKTELKKDSFFEAKHELKLLNSQDNTILYIKSLKDFENIIEEEKNSILSNQDLKDKFHKIDSKIKNQDLENLREYLKENQDLLVELENLNKFWKKVLISNIKNKKDLFDDLLNKILESEEELAEILKEAKKEQKLWLEVIEEFNRRFFVPFKIDIANQEELVLENNTTPFFKYIFDDGRTSKTTTKEDLMEVLSGGEKRALYLLNIIFEIKARKRENLHTTFIVDDIADSFDYKNKYAIIEYLKELSDDSNFNLIILTHNFDFYRNVSMRLDISRLCRFHVIKNNLDIELVEELYQNNPFETWKTNMKTNRIYDILAIKKHIIALIPFVRNIIEFTMDRNVNDNTNINSDFLFLTSLLHHKNEIQNIKIKDLKKIFEEYIGRSDFDESLDDNIKIYDIIMDLANNYISNQDNNLENKLILAIAIRLKSEEYMKQKITDQNFLDELDSAKNQTRNLYNKFIKDFPSEFEAKKLLDSVNIMTPENIHLNAFMYEPILDMGIDSLIKLYSDINSLN